MTICPAYSDRKHFVTTKDIASVTERTLFRWFDKSTALHMEVTEYQYF